MTAATAPAPLPRSLLSRIGHRPLLIAGALIAVVALFASGALQIEKWAPFLRPNILYFLGQGLLGTLQIAAGALIASIVLGIPLGIARSGLRGPARWLVGTWIELARATPILFMLIIVRVVNVRIDIGLEWLAIAIIGLTIYNSAVLAEIVRAGISSIARGEVEAARSLGLTYGQTMRHVVLPQALARMMPAIVSQLITLVKDTSLAYIIGGQELVRYARNVYVAYANILETYIVVAFVFFVMCYALSRLSRRLEARQPADQRVAVSGEEDQLQAAPLAGVATVGGAAPPGR